MQIDALCHTPADNMATLGEAAEHAGHNWREIDVPNDLSSAYDPLNADILVVLGGGLGAYQQDDFPFIATELDILRQRLHADKPTLGICLGAQLMAAALGADVYPGERGRERGWYKVELTNGGEQTPLCHFRDCMVMHHHSDTFDLPTGCSNLARGPVYSNQAFQIGKNGMAIQFHPEVRQRELEYWFIGMADDAATDRLDMQELRSQTAQYLPALRQATTNFFHEWIGKVTHARNCA